VKHIRQVVGDDGVLCIPTAPGPAPRIDASGDEVDAFRQMALRLTCIAGLSGLPQVNVPAGQFDGGPIGLSVIGPAGSDKRLLQLAARLDAALNAARQA
jgi:amidase